MVRIGNFYNANHLFICKITTQCELSGVVWRVVLAGHTCRRILAQVVVPFHQFEEVVMGECCGEKKKLRLVLVRQDATDDVDIPVVGVLERNFRTTDELNTVEEVIGETAIRFLACCYFLFEEVSRHAKQGFQLAIYALAIERTAERFIPLCKKRDANRLNWS